ncbi:chitobiase/beta-hexosaminidase C-terminal domain-containing protein [Pseudobutyrivibrio xylanivorans]|uniref:Zinc-ribbon domain-containing protein n=1 Tax=Pseudobutyrivibrio xylanivorans TaxID=185007 RepID=A0A1G5RWE9_PSEXY|nr:chitobiase/beta-hexosaminidase C-terminal domain-containing protein [Pseudobutyrivibrio xylanivorans]SCZ78247.1 zinc-ribbon domain-containing protein [Pseudobutyrivibrio xylanivorans]
MNCKKCGAEIESGFLYCPKCGESIQLVPNYDVVEEELLSRVVEDKDKAKNNRFATGVYKPVKIETNKQQQTEKITSSPSALSRNKDFFIKLAVFLGIVILGLIIIIPLLGSHSYDNVMNSAIAAESDSQYAKALGLYQEAYEIDNASFEAVYGLGRMYYKVKEYDKAIEYLTIALEEDSTNKKIYTLLLDSYSSTGDMDSIYKLQSKAPNQEILALFDAYVVQPPEFSDLGGDYDEDVYLVLTSSKGNQIFYTLDGKNPTTSGKLFSKTIKLEEGVTEVKAVSLSSSGDYSEVVSETYNIVHPSLGTPVVSPNGGTYTQQEYITVTVPEGCKAYYTWDGTDPSEVGILYTEPFPILKGASVLTVVIIDSKGNTSPLYRGDYIYNP